ncbi:MAG TPA: hypothetical protein VND02_08600 [Actinomycetota bacterium]|nr:hypothetical protein [Actinomycetota bacterium]
MSWSRKVVSISRAAAMVWMASSWTSPAMRRRSSSWAHTTRPSSQRRCSSRRTSRSWARWRSVTSRSTTTLPVTRPLRSARGVADSS